MEEEIKKELKELYNSFDKTNNLYEKGYIVTLFGYLKRIFSDDDINQMYQNVYSKLNVYNVDYLQYFSVKEDKIEEFMQKKYDFFIQKIGKVRKVTELKGYLPTLSSESIEKIIDLFLQSISMDIFSFYKKYKLENRILFSHDGNTAYTSLYNSNTIVFIPKMENLKDIMILMHELGHAYYFYINNAKIRERDDILVELKDEIPAKILEMKFIKFIKEKIDYQQGLILDNIFDLNMYEYYIEEDDFDSLKYLIASFIAKKISDKNFNISKYFERLYRNDIYNIVVENNNIKKLAKVLKR